MDYEKTIPFTGNTEKAFEVARNSFVQYGFKILKETESTLELAGESHWPREGKNSMDCISRVYVDASRSELSIKAEFGGLKSGPNVTKWAGVVFLLGGLLLLLVVGIPAVVQGGMEGVTDAIVLGPVSIVIGIWLIAKGVSYFKLEVSQRLDVLLDDMAAQGQNI